MTIEHPNLLILKICECGIAIAGIWKHNVRDAMQEFGSAKHREIAFQKDEL
jgi:hypothetical protein